MRLCDDGCRSFGDGHRTHHIRARLAGGTPWGWRDGMVVAAVDERILIRYLVSDAEVSVEHHRHLPVAVGDPVRVHEEFRLLATSQAWHSVALVGGLGAVPAPAHPGLSANDTRAGIVDLAAGDALPMDEDGWS